MAKRQLSPAHKISLNGVKRVRKADRKKAPHSAVAVGQPEAHKECRARRFFNGGITREYYGCRAGCW